MELISLMYSSIQIIRLIDLKFGMYVIGYRSTNCIDFGELRITSFLKEHKKEFLYITVYGVKF